MSDGSPIKAARIRELNDQLRCKAIGGRIVITRGSQKNVEAGFSSNLGVVWFYKLDTSTNLDPSVRRALPDGADEFDVVVLSPIMRAALAESPGQLREVRRALRLSDVAATFGHGRNRVEVRTIDRRPATRQTADETP